VSESKTIDLDGPVHYVEHGGDGPPLVCVHGLGGSHLNWMDLAPRLTDRAHVYAIDLAGHGRTRREGRSSSVRANTRLLDRFLVEVAGTPALLVGNSMGGMISILEAARRPKHVSGLVLLDPAVPRARRERPDLTVARNFAVFALPGVGERVLARRRARLGPERMLQETLELCTVDPTRLSPELREASLDLARERASDRDIDAAFLQSARSLLRILARPSAYLERIQAVQAPTLLIQGARDRLVPLSAARSVAALRPDWVFEVLPDIGHVPQFEAPERTAELIHGWLDGAGASALTDAATVG
jgi:pimeloyl-ACP methyl ester carboxylesterase